ncbi:MAG: hypothetical protein OEY01_11690, partial [Desulfobulbaceae bacterium]|nr:hypothetical protein [Desulfobulbaceae bacterium]
MNEFDQCPGCNQGLLLDTPDNNGLRCLDCGYTCQASSEPAVISEQEPDKLAYWQRRCEAAEKVIEAITANNEGGYLITRQAWLALKEDGEPA